MQHEIKVVKNVKSFGRRNLSVFFMTSYFCLFFVFALVFFVVCLFVFVFAFRKAFSNLRLSVPKHSSFGLAKSLTHLKLHYYCYYYHYLISDGMGMELHFFRVMCCR